MSDYKAYIFDFDLTLADSSRGILECFKHTLAHFGCDIPDDTTIYNTIGHTLQDSFDILTGIPMNPLREDMRKIYGWAKTNGLLSDPRAVCSHMDKVLITETWNGKRFKQAGLMI